MLIAFLNNQTIKYIISGGSAAVIMFGSLYILTEYIGLWYIHSVIIAFLLSFVVSFTMQKFWTFQNKDKKYIHKQLSLYLLVSVFNLIFNGSVVYFLVEWVEIWYMGAQFITSAVLALTSFLIYKFLIFNNKENTSDSITQESSSEHIVS